MVVDVAYISKEHSADTSNAPGSVTGILAVQGAFAEHAAMLDRLGAPWRLLRAREDFDESIGRVILPGGESTTQGKLLRSTGLFEPIAAHIAAGGVATPADAALMMELGAEGVFVGSGIFKSGEPAKRAAAIVQATANWQDADLLARLSADLGEAMVGINEEEIDIIMAQRGE